LGRPEPQGLCAALSTAHPSPHGLTDLHRALEHDREDLVDDRGSRIAAMIAGKLPTVSGGI